MDIFVCNRDKFMSCTNLQTVAFFFFWNRLRINNIYVSISFKGYITKLSNSSLSVNETFTNSSTQSTLSKRFSPKMKARLWGIRRHKLHASFIKSLCFFLLLCNIKTHFHFGMMLSPTPLMNLSWRHIFRTLLLCRFR